MNWWKHRVPEAHSRERKIRVEDEEKWAARVLTWYIYQLGIPQRIDLYSLGRPKDRIATIVKMQKTYKKLRQEAKMANQSTRQMGASMCGVKHGLILS